MYNSDLYFPNRHQRVLLISGLFLQSGKMRGMLKRVSFLPFVLIIALSLGGVVFGCSSPQEPGICHTAIVEPETEAADADEEDEDDDDDEDEPRMVRPVRPAEWLDLIVRSRVGEQVSQDCTGATIGQYEPSQLCREAEEENRRQNPDQYEDDTPEMVELTEESVIDRRLTNSHRLIWVVTHRYPNGDGLGPIALVERRYDEDAEDDDDEDPDTVHVLAVGMLRARSERPRLRLLTVREPLVTVTERFVCPDEEEDAPPQEINFENCQRQEELLLSEDVHCRRNDRVSTCELTRAARRELRRDDETNLECDDDEDVRTCWRRRQMIVVEGETCVPPEEADQFATTTPPADGAEAPPAAAAAAAAAAEGDGEDEEEEEEVCNRSADFMFRDGNRFVQAELHHIAGRCLGRAQMLYSERTEREILGGWLRRFDLAASYEFAGARLVMHQQVIAVDRDPRRPEIPPRPFRRAEADNHWFLFQGRFITPNETLWERMLVRHGSVQVPPEERASR